MKDKVKELKEFIQKSADLGQWYKLLSGDITMMEVVDYINELESENEKLKLTLGKGYFIIPSRSSGKSLSIDKEIRLDIFIVLVNRLAELENKMKNKKLIELPCIYKTKNGFRGIRYEVVFFNDYYNTIDCYVCKTRELAEQKLKELKGARK